MWLLFPVQGEQGQEQCLESMQSLCSVVVLMTRMMAPFTPFFTEHMFQNLRHLMSWEPTAENASVHFTMLPKPRQGPDHTINYVVSPYLKLRIDLLLIQNNSIV